LKRAFGGGFGNGMLSTFIQNNSMLNSRGYFEMRKEFLKVSKKNAIVDPLKATPEQLRLIRKQIIFNKRIDVFRKVRAAAITIAITLLFFSGFIYVVRMVFGF
jgi:hypothetical protein